MSRQLEQLQEDRNKRRHQAILRAVEYELESAVGRAGGTLLGFSAQMGSDDCMLVLKVELPAGRQVSFVGSSTLGDCLIKAVRLAKKDKLVWREDKYVKPS